MNNTIIRTAQPRWPVPRTPEEAEALLRDFRDTLPGLDHDSEAFDEAVREACGFAGCFNRVISAEMRRELVRLIGQCGPDAIGPALEDLVDCPRAEQLDVTVAVMHAIVNGQR